MYRALPALFLIGAFAIVSAPASAAPVALDCSVPNNGVSTWISPRYFISYDTETKLAAVSDPVALGTNNGQPIQAEVDRKTRNGVIIKWFVQARSSSGQNANIRYSANINGKRVSISANPLSYSNNFHGGGTCKQLAIKQ